MRLTELSQDGRPLEFLLGENDHVFSKGPSHVQEVERRLVVADDNSAGGLLATSDDVGDMLLAFDVKIDPHERAGNVIEAARSIELNALALRSSRSASDREACRSDAAARADRPKLQTHVAQGSGDNRHDDTPETRGPQPSKVESGFKVETSFGRLCGS